MSSATPKRIVFFAPFGSWTVHEQINAVLAASLRERGAEVLVIGCDGIYQETCYVLTHSSNPKLECMSCCGQGRQLFNAFNLPHKYLREYINAEDIQGVRSWINTLDPEKYQEAYYEDLAVGSWAVPMVCSYFRITPVRLHLEKPRRVLKRHLFDAVITYKAIQRLIAHYRPDTLVTYAGVGTVHGAALCCCKNNGVGVVTHTLGRNRGSYMFSANEEISAFRNRHYVAKLWKDVPLSIEECDQIHKYFEERLGGIDHNFQSFQEYNTEHNIREALRIPPHARIVAFFTSSEYERCYYPEYKNVASQIDILRTLMEIFRERDEYLVIRHHPNIGGGSSDEADAEFLTGAYELTHGAPSNVRIVMPHEPINSYALLRNADATFAPFSTIGLESLGAGIPTLASKISPYSSGIPFTIDRFDRNSLEQWLNFLLSEKARVSIDHLRQLYRFMHAFTYKHSQVLKVCHVQQGITIQSLNDLLPGHDAVLDRICDHILTGTPIFEQPTPEHRMRSAEAETKFLESRLQFFNKSKMQAAQLGQSKVEFKEQPPKIEVLRLIYETLIPERSQASWIKRQRTKEFLISDIEISDYGDHREVVEKLHYRIQSSDAEYLIVTNEFTQYDEAFISATQARLQQSAEGCVWGGWLFTRGVGIERSFFTPRHPTSSYEAAKCYHESFTWPQTVLSFGVFSKALLLDTIIGITGAPSRDHAAEKTFSLLQSGRVLLTNIPLLVVHPYRKCEKLDIGVSRTQWGRPLGLTIDGREFNELNEMVNCAAEYLTNGKEDGALRIIETALEFTEVPEVFLIKSVALLKLNRRDEAITALEALLTRDPGHAQGLLLKQQILQGAR